MPQTTALAWSDELLGYDFGKGHPMSPKRLELTYDLADQLGLFADDSGVTISADPPASPELLATVHEPEYLAAVAAASLGTPDLAFGLGSEDNPIFDGMYEAAARIVGGTVSLAEMVWTREAEHGVNLAGGMHHAMPGRASGFCIFNDVAVAIRRLQQMGAKRVAYVDLDAHHGDGVERIFWDDPTVLTISIHQDGRTVFPGTGDCRDLGGPGALGSAVNLPLPPRTGSGEWLRAFDAVVPPILRAYQPDMIISQHGCDAHHLDPLSDLRVGIYAQWTAAHWTHELAHDLCDGRWLALGGGGYAVLDVVPMMWTALLAEALHQPLDLSAPMPERWRNRVAEITGRASNAMQIPAVGWQPWQSQSGACSVLTDRASAVDCAILDTRRAAFPHYGLLP